MFLLLMLLTQLGWLHAGHNPHKTILQTTVPEKISSFDTSKDPENNIAYIITIEGKPYFVHLTRQSFLSPTSVIYSYGKEDTLLSKPLLGQINCNYEGYVAGFPHSLATLNTCSGLRGILQFKNISYGIEPMEAESGFMHMIFEEENDNIDIPLLKENDTSAWLDNSQYQVRKSSKRTEMSMLFPRYLQMHIVVDKNLFEYMGSDIKAVTQKIIQIIGLVNTMFSQLKLTVLISSIEIWSNENKISTIGNPDNVLFRFLKWKEQYLVDRPHQIAYLLAFQKHPDFIGSTFPGKVCDRDYAAGVALYPGGLTLESYSVIIVQLLGLNLGLNYDTDNCYCSGDVCTMTPKAMHSKGVKYFSTCSLDEFKYFASQPGLQCLHNYPLDQPVYKQQKKICGNGLLESGEQCDCGTLQNCTHKKCCDPRSCTFKGKVTCGSGECCSQDCKIKPLGDKCRDSFDEECDFVEFCDGTHSYCVPDTYARNGELCDSGDSYCFGGRCRMFNRQCQKLIGGDARGAPFTCYDEINSRADRYGNCGRRHCTYSDLLCGKLVCSWPHKRLIKRPNLSVIYTHIRNDICVSTHISIEKPSDRQSVTTVRSPEDRDETFVEDGTICGPEMYCKKFRCVEVRHEIDLTQCNPAVTCNLHGTCNNLGHCHCQKNFAPPDCRPLKGEFGSIDDGHPIKSAKVFLEGRYATSQKNWLQVILYVSLPVIMITTAAVLLKQNKLRDLCYREETESESSVSEESNSISKLSHSDSDNL
ncbi:disintegrin and metalloproteinase domain-containing protein 5-like [Choloepus didactylus]|uniref:disintegrin and metalloproteinase domain-containing protein 5-like n=1 Tax=Choloepus didactylus TaxID=27675 RepID=UPI00189FB975|nr:disintegrin and metalloproteinase domain-containing protein 5-like [Choloepus didactylus]